jgi:putative ABC transport system permease protein
MQMWDVTRMNLRSLADRWGGSLVIIVSIAAVVAVVVSVIAVASGIQRSAAATGRPDRAIVLRGGSAAELTSLLLRPQVVTIMGAPGVRKLSDGTPVGTADAVLVAVLHKRSGEEANITLRGVGRNNPYVRPNIRIVRGRMFQRNLQELIVGTAAQAKFQGLDVGSRIKLHGSEWAIVGVFESGGDWHESELLAPNEIVMPTYRRFAFQSVTVLLDSPAAFEDFKSALTANPTLSVTVMRETEYYEQISAQLSGTLFLVADVLGAIMAAGAVFGALNCFYSAVRARRTEIATLRAIGFGGVAVASSVLVEALLLALVGALIGGAIAWIAVNGNTGSALGSANSLAQVMFRIAVRPAMLAQGIFWACAIGVAGALFPAIGAARSQVAVALRPS